MFFILSKILYFLVMPLTIIIICLIAGLVAKDSRYRKKFMLIGVVLLLFFTNDFIINTLLLAWEVPPTPFHQVSNYDVAIILTGVTSTEKPPHDRVYLTKGADRIMHSVQLYKQQKVKNLLVTGGSGSLTDTDIKEADEIKRVLLLCNIPEKDIIIENQSRNTRENAAFSAVILNQKFPGGKYLLVSSAFHLRRAQASFKKEGIQADSFSTDFNTYPTRYTPDSIIIPSENALHKWSILIKEVIGFTAYKIAGYI